AGVPASAPVAAVKVTPAGRAPLSVSVGAGKPLAATVKEPAVPVVKVVLLALVKAGAWSTVRVKLCVALVPTPLAAVKVSISPARACRGGATQRPGGGGEGHPGRQGAGLGECRGREAAGRHREGAGRSDRERSVVGAGEGRGLVHRQGEALGSITAHAVGRRE